MLPLGGSRRNFWVKLIPQIGEGWGYCMVNFGTEYAFWQNWRWRPGGGLHSRECFFYFHLLLLLYQYLTLLCLLSDKNCIRSVKSASWSNSPWKFMFMYRAEPGAYLQKHLATILGYDNCLRYVENQTYDEIKMLLILWQIYKICRNKHKRNNSIHGIIFLCVYTCNVSDWSVIKSNKITGWTVVQALC